MGEEDVPSGGILLKVMNMMEDKPLNMKGGVMEGVY